MTALTIIILVLLLVLIAWAVGITMLYAELVRGLRQITSSDMSAMGELFDQQGRILSLLREALDAADAVGEISNEFKTSVEELKDASAKNKKFALETIQQARRIYQQASEIAGQPQLKIDGDAFINQLKEKIQNEQ